jgi:hypothetical protein
MGELVALPDLQAAVFAFFAPASEESPSENPLQTNFREFLFYELR